MKYILNIFIVCILLLSCSTKQTTNIELRDKLIAKIDTSAFRLVPSHTSLVELDEFFEGNFDNSSIAPNLQNHPGTSFFYKTLKEIKNKSEVNNIFVEIKDIVFDTPKSLGTNWPYSNAICIITSATDNEILKWVKKLSPENSLGTTLLPSNIEVPTGYSIKTIWWD